DDSIRFYQFYADKQDSGIIDCYITNPDGYNNYLARTRFGALYLGNDIRTSAFDFICPDTAKYYAIISNQDRAYAANWLDFSLKLYVPSLTGITQRNQFLPNADWRVASLVKGRIRIQLNGINIHAPPDFQLFNASGGNMSKGLKLETVVDNELCLNVEALPTGIYFLKIFIGNSIQTKKIAVVR
ncbi:MAG: T9SS type A sorting domain-containing protein, partial [candidate division WOR-3 bacterium]|nr:T9SS type A sorting domain-containing protein [candidate division WOR-3 bacterium]